MRNTISDKEAGIKFIERKDYENAIIKLSNYVKNNNNDKNGYLLLGDAYIGLGRNEKADFSFSEALDIDPTDMDALIKYSSNKLASQDYKEILKKHHISHKPSRYIEIGVCRGDSFKLAQPETVSIGIDPEPQLKVSTLPARHKVISDTSDRYFDSGQIEQDFGGEPFDMAFLDGMHIFEYLLRDFINVEKYSHSESVVFIHDLYPITAETATRERNSDFWSGDVWKLVLCLKEYRPDLEIEVLPCPPTGLGVVTNLDSNSEILKNNYKQILDKYIGMPFSVIETDKDSKLSLSGLDSKWL